MQDQKPYQAASQPSSANEQPLSQSNPDPQFSGGPPPQSVADSPASSVPPQDNSVASSSQAAVSIQVPDDASDADLIEKEWVIKAKDIVHHTQNNPHEQQNAMSKFKADYMKKRYNKDIKTEGA